MSSSAAGWPPSSPRNSAMVATPPSPSLPACTLIPSAAGGKNSTPASTADLPSACAGPAPGGDPMTEDKFVRRSLRTLSAGLEKLDHEACPTTVAGLLRELGYNLRVNV